MTDLEGHRQAPGDPGREQRARSFGQGAAAYRAARPPYPPEAIRWLVPAGATRVLDLAAGTGKLTEGLVGAGFDVVAVEPDDGMRAELVSALPGVAALPGTAEAIPLADGAVDAVVVAQAWHWFAADRAAGEIARVLRPAGRLGVAWNVRDPTRDWVQDFTQLIHRGDSLEPMYREPELGAQFGPLTRATFRWSHRIPVARLRTLAASRSHTLRLPAAEREQLLDDVDALARSPRPRGARGDRSAVPHRVLARGPAVTRTGGDREPRPRTVLSEP